MVKTCIITGYGINADDELKKAFELAGSDVQKIHINDLIRIPALLGTFLWRSHRVWKSVCRSL